MRILVVSTDYDTRIIFATALQSVGYDVRELADPDGVVEAARDCSLVITDFPTLTDSGKTVTQLLRNEQQTRHIKILNATTHAFSDEIDQARAAGVDATIVLPAAPNRVVASVESLLEIQ